LSPSGHAAVRREELAPPLADGLAGPDVTFSCRGGLRRRRHEGWPGGPSGRAR